VNEQAGEKLLELPKARINKIEYKELRDLLRLIAFFSVVEFL